MENMNTGIVQRRHKNDLFLLLAVFLIVIVSALIYTFTREEGSYAVVLKNGAEIGRYSLSKNCEVPVVDGDMITNILVICDGNAQISEATCPDQICVEHRSVSKVGETIVCLPNEVVIKIIASENGDSPDIVS